MQESAELARKSYISHFATEARLISDRIFDLASSLGKPRGTHTTGEPA